MDTNSHHIDCGSELQSDSNSHKGSPTHSYDDEVNTPDEDGNVPLHIAVIEDDLEMLKDLLKNPNINVDYKTSYGETALLMSVMKSRCEAFITQLLIAGCDANFLCKDGRSPIYEAMRRNFTNIAHELIKKGANVNVVTEINISPLDLAVIKNNLEGVCMLLYYGADVNVSYRYGAALLIYAVYRNAHEIAQILYNFYDDCSYANSLMSALDVVAQARRRVPVADVYHILDRPEGPLMFSLKCKDSKLFKLIWSKFDYEMLLNGKKSFLSNYISMACLPETKYLECLCLILNSPKAFDFMDELFKSSSFYQLQDSLNRCCTEPSDRITVVNIYLSLGFKMEIKDINHAFDRYKFGEEVEAFIYSFDNDKLFSFDDLESPLLGFILAMEEFSRITPQLLYKILRKCEDRKDFDVLKYFTMPSCYKQRWEISVSQHVHDKYEKNLHEFPSLLELSRNKLYDFILETCNITRPYQFHDAVKNLKVPRHVQDIVRFKKPIY